MRYLSCPEGKIVEKGVPEDEREKSSYTGLGDRDLNLLVKSTKIFRPVFLG